jgi:hypothetical protein
MLKNTILNEIKKINNQIINEYTKDVKIFKDFVNDAKKLHPTKIDFIEKVVNERNKIQEIADNIPEHELKSDLRTKLFYYNTLITSLSHNNDFYDVYDDYESLTDNSFVKI